MKIMVMFGIHCEVAVSAMCCFMKPIKSVFIIAMSPGVDNPPGPLARYVGGHLVLLEDLSEI